MGEKLNYTVIGRGLKSAFIKAYDNGVDPKDVMMFIMETTSTGRDEEYAARPPSALPLFLTSLPWSCACAREKRRPPSGMRTGPGHGGNQASPA